MQHESKRLNFYQWGIILGSALLLVCAILLIKSLVAESVANRKSVLYVGICKDDAMGEGLAKEMARTWNDSLVVRCYSTPDSLLMALDDEEFDLVTSPIARTQVVAENYACSEPLLISRFVLVSNLQVPILSYPSAMGAKTISINGNAAVQLRLHHLMAEMADTMFCDVHNDWSTYQLLQAVEKGDLNYAVVPEYEYEVHKKQLPHVQLNTPVGFDQDYIFVMRKDAHVLDIKLLNEFIRMKSVGLIEAEEIK